MLAVGINHESERALFLLAAEFGLHPPLFTPESENILKM